MTESEAELFDDAELGPMIASAIFCVPFCAAVWGFAIYGFVKWLAAWRMGL